MSASQRGSIDGGVIANPHDAPPEHRIPLDHLRSLYYRPAAGSGILVPSSEVSSAYSSPQQPQLTAPQDYRTSSPALRSGWSSHSRADSIPSRNARPNSSSFWSHNVPNAHPGTHASILAQAQRQAQDRRSPSPALSLSEHGHRQLSYIHAAPGSSASSFGLDLDRADLNRGLQPPVSTSSRRSSMYGYLPTRLLPVAEKKRILVTGGAGFVGSHLVDRLMLMGHEVLVIDNFFTGQKSNLSQWHGHPNFELIRHDVVQPLVVEVDQIYHLACPASPISYQANQVKTIKTNFMGSINMLGLAKRTKARFLLASTSEVYGDPDVHPQPETYNGNVNPVGPRACYDEGKRVAETLTYGYYYQDGVDVRVARIFNTYGPRMHPHDGRVVSNLILQALRGEPLTVFGDGSQTRSFMFIHDLIDGLISLMNAEPPVDVGSLQTPLPRPPQAQNTQAASAADILTDAPDSIIPSEATATTPAVPTALSTSSNAAASDGYFHPDAHRFDVHTPVNLGNPGEFTIMELVQLVQKCVAKVKAQDARPTSASSSSNHSDTIDASASPPRAESEIRFFAMPKDDPKQRRPDITRATSLLDWYPRWKLEDGLEEMTRWYWERIKEGSV
ncbi:NAD-dependent epimerase/dehydratase [Kalmanozyma brasiliensis GHG001]|uniref:UDP-glucuronic acid decarboxylase 1 n=1 Tax=Kalmanozyma brasiliensis (strain GHG001) TaxID=1365824 RepID=V5ET30_KALBG|nr:NAD-dependent epimerase/dehydratase [Kalmanozyma brasiliensis GHG001]EST05124.1 NAD-dependent epimerase/dehydratase [Kalmanozyma brasiliensis GHG001]